MGRAVALLLSAVFVTSAARADGLPPAPALDVSDWFLRGNIDDDALRSPEGRTYLPPNILAVAPTGATGSARYSMSETR